MKSEDQATVVADVSATEVDRPKSPSWVPSYSVSSQGASPRHSPKQLAVELVEEHVPAPAEPVLAAEVVEEVVQPEVVVEPIVEVTEADATPEVAVPEESTVEETVAEAIEVVPVVDVPVIATEEVDVAEVCSTRFVGQACAHSICLCSSRPKHQHQRLGFLPTRLVRKALVLSTRPSKLPPIPMSRKSSRFLSPLPKSKPTFLAKHPPFL